MNFPAQALTPLHPQYPPAFLSLPHPPAPLYLQGSFLPQDQAAIAIVGTRNMTDYGRHITIDFVTAFVQAGFTIISGLARGIDTIAHTTALKCKGRTIAVLGSGLDVIYPPENRALYQQIPGSGALISEFSLGTKPLGKNFLARNRLISGLSRAVVVIEGSRKSGTISTAAHAADQGREVFAVPGPITSPQSQGPLYLIKQGANLATTPEDVLDAIL